MKYLNELIEVLLSVVIFGALFPTINTQITALSLDNITIAGTSYDMSWIAYILVLGLLFGLMWLGLKGFKQNK